VLRRLRCAHLLLALAAAGGGCGAGADDCPFVAPDDDATWADGFAALELEAIDEVNTWRARGAICGGERFGPAPALAVWPALQTAARAHSRDMAERGFTAHESPGGCGIWDRLETNGWSPDTRARHRWGENIAWGFASAREVVRWWIDSPPHCRNVMDPGFEWMGVGYYEADGTEFRRYWTQNLAAGRPLSPTSPEG